MTTTKANAITLLLCSAALVFNGCTTKYVPQKCLVEKPVQSSPDWSCAAKFPKSDYQYSECLADKILLLAADYEIMSQAFEKCK